MESSAHVHITRTRKSTSINYYWVRNETKSKGKSVTRGLITDRFFPSWFFFRTKAQHLFCVRFFFVSFLLAGARWKLDQTWFGKSTSNKSTVEWHTNCLRYVALCFPVFFSFSAHIGPCTADPWAKNVQTTEKNRLLCIPIWSMFIISVLFSPHCCLVCYRTNVKWKT